jgi:hypothetical protein
VRVVLVHGIHTREGTTNMSRLAPWFRAAGFDVVIFEYGWVGVLRARWRNPGIARRLAAVVRPGDHLVCHSNGAVIAWLAMRDRRMECRHVSLIAPALDSNRILGGALWTDVYHNRCDHVLWLARLFRHHAWGSMGRDGCTSEDAAAMGVTNIDTATHRALPEICGHLDYFAPHVLPALGPWIVQRHLERA